MSDLVKENLENLEKSQEKQTGMIRGQEFGSLMGDPVLVLLPTTTDKLLAHT